MINALHEILCFLKNKIVFEGWFISLNVTVKYERGWMVNCSNNDAHKVQVFC